VLAEGGVINCNLKKMTCALLRLFQEHSSFLEDETISNGLTFIIPNGM